MKFNYLDSIIFYSEKDLEIFLQNYTIDNYKLKLKSNNIFMYLIIPFLFCTEYYIYKHYTNEPNSYVIRIWKNNLNMPVYEGSFDYFGGIDYKITDDHLKLDFFNPCDSKFPPKINKNTTLLINHVFKIKEEYNKNKIIIDLNESLYAYNIFWKHFNFKPLTIRSTNNPYWFKYERLD
jgi:hypothetical protein